MEFISRSAEQTRRLGMRLGALLRTGDMVCLVGDLGAGKTTFVQGIGSGWGSLDAVSSPTFVLVNVYRRRGANRAEERLYHLDSYRLSGPAEADDLDLEALLEQGPLVIEWAERIETVLPPEGLWVRLRWIEENQRDLVFSARGRRYELMLAALRRQLFGVT
jgi:tRNA threonylcarbamoyladenosine biosynthesis protein TsaE